MNLPPPPTIFFPSSLHTKALFNPQTSEKRRGMDSMRALSLLSLSLSLSLYLSLSRVSSNNLLICSRCGAAGRGRRGHSRRATHRSLRGLTPPQLPVHVRQRLAEHCAGAGAAGAGAFSFFNFFAGGATSASSSCDEVVPFSGGGGRFSAALNGLEVSLAAHGLVLEGLAITRSARLVRRRMPQHGA